MTNILDLLNQWQYNFYFLVVDKFLDIDLYPTLKNFYLIYAYKSEITEKLKQKNTPYFCLEEQGIVLSEKNSGRLLETPSVIEYIKSTSQNKTVAIIPFKPSAKIDLLCRSHHWTLVANPSEVNRTLEDKIKFYNLASASAEGLPLIPSLISKLDQNSFTHAQNKFGPKLVIQTHFGWAGKSTHTSSDFSQLPQNIYNTTVKISPYLSGYSLLNNCCLTKHGLIQSPAALQYTGLAQYTSNPFTTVGRQWPCMAPENIKAQVYDITQKFSDTILKSYNYRGFFGLDFFVDDQQNVYLLECNPRLTASFAFYTHLELRAQLNPLFMYHLAEFTLPDYDIDINAEKLRFSNPNIIGSEITPKDPEGNTITKINGFTAFSDSSNPINLNSHAF